MMRITVVTNGNRVDLIIGAVAVPLTRVGARTLGRMLVAQADGPARSDGYIDVADGTVTVRDR